MCVCVCLELHLALRRNQGKSHREAKRNNKQTNQKSKSSNAPPLNLRQIPASADHSRAVKALRRELLTSGRLRANPGGSAALHSPPPPPAISSDCRDSLAHLSRDSALAKLWEGKYEARDPVCVCVPVGGASAGVQLFIEATSASTPTC